jgi:hypothetical protein
MHDGLFVPIGLERKMADFFETKDCPSAIYIYIKIIIIIIIIIIKRIALLLDSKK